MDKTISTKISTWCLIRAIVMIIFFILLSMPFYVHQNRNRMDEFIPMYFLYDFMAVVAFAVIITYIATISIPKIVIESDHVRVYRGLKFKYERFELNDICGMNRQHEDNNYSIITSPFIRANEQDLTIYFRNGRRIHLWRKYYDNYEDIKMWFYVFCKQKGLLKTDPLQVAKRSQYKRPERVKKL